MYLFLSEALHLRELNAIHAPYDTFLNPKKLIVEPSWKCFLFFFLLF